MPKENKPSEVVRPDLDKVDPFEKLEKVVLSPSYTITAFLKSLLKLSSSIYPDASLISDHLKFVLPKIPSGIISSFGVGNNFFRTGFISTVLLHGLSVYDNPPLAFTRKYLLRPKENKLAEAVRADLDKVDSLGKLEKVVLSPSYTITAFLKSLLKHSSKTYPEAFSIFDQLKLIFQNACCDI